MARLGLRTICYLGLEPLREENQAFMVDQAIEFHHKPTEGNLEPFTDISTTIVLEVLRLMLDTRHHPILVHCDKGNHRTGCVIGCLRKLESWALTSILDEYGRYTGANTRILDQQFIQLFDASLVTD